jgi:phospholipid/cholesterol/gamma-HCH transport system substrate-binding protein
MRNIGAEIASGVAIFSAVVIFIVGFLYLKNVTFSRDNYIVNARFEKVTGLEISDFVSVSGLRKGSVKSLALDSQNAVIVRFEIDRAVKLPNDSRAQIKSLGMVGEKFVEIIPGSSSEFLGEGDFMVGSNEGDLSDLGGSMDGLMGEAEQFLLDLRETLEVVFDDASRQDLKASLANMRSISKAFNDNSPHIENTLTRLENISVNLDEMLTERRSKVETSIDNLHQMSTKLGDFTDKIDSSLTSVNTLLTKIENQEGALGKVIYGDDLYNDLRQLTTELDGLVQDLKKRPQKYLNLGFIKVF